MKTLTTSIFSKLMLSLFAVIAFAIPTSAGVKLSLGDIKSETVGNKVEVTLAVVMENLESDQISDLQFEITLPTELDFVKGSEEKNADRLTRKFTVEGAVQKDQLPKNVVKFVVVGSDLTSTIKGTSGTLFTFKATTKAGVTEMSEGLTASFGKTTATTTEAAPVVVETPVSPIDIPAKIEVSFSADQDEVIFTKGETKTIAISMSNDAALVSMQGVISLPEGISIVQDEEDEYFGYTSRIPASASFNYFPSSGKFTLSSPTNAKFNGEEGTFFTITLKADETLTGESEIVLKNFVVGTPSARAYRLEDVITIKASLAKATVTVVSADEEKGTVEGGAGAFVGDEITVVATPKTNYDFVSWTADDAVVSTDASYTFTVTEDITLTANFELNADVAAFNTFVAEQAAAVEALAKADDSAESQTIIADAVADIEALTYDPDKTLDENKAEVTAIVTQATTDLEAQRDAELAAKKAEFDTYKEAQTAVAQGKFQEGDSKRCEQLVNDAVDAIEALVYDETKSLDENKAAVDAIVTPLADEIADLKAAEAAALATIQGQIEQLKQDVEAAQSKINEYDLEEVVETYTAQLQEISAQIEAVDAEAMILDGNLEFAENDAIKASITKVLDDAEKKYDALLAQNDARYNTLLNYWNDYKAASQKKIEEISANDADVIGEYAARIEDIYTSINQMKTDFTAAHLNNELNSNTTLVDFGSVVIDTDIANLKTEADYAEAQWTDFLTPFIEVTVPELTAQLAALTEAVNALHVKDHFQENLTEIQALIAAAQEAVENKYETRDAYIPDGLTAAFVAAQKATVTDAITAVQAAADAAEAANEAAYEAIKTDIAALQTQLDALKVKFAAGAVYATVVDLFADNLQAIQDEIDVLTDNNDESYAAGNLNATSNIDAEKAAIAAEIAALDASAENEVANNALNEQIAEVQAAINAASDVIADYADCVQVTYDAQIAAQQAALDAIFADVKAQYTAGSLTADSSIDTDAITDALPTILEAAAASQATYTELAARLDAFATEEVEGELYTSDFEALNSQLDDLKADAASKKAEMDADAAFVANADVYAAAIDDFDTALAAIDAAAEDAAAQLVADKAAFEAYKSSQKTAAEALAKSEDSAASQQLIVDAKAAIDALAFDVDLSLDGNKAAMEDLVAQLDDDLAAQRVADSQVIYQELKAELDALDEAIAEAKAILDEPQNALIADEYNAQLDVLQAKVDAARADLDARQNVLTSSSQNIESITVEEIDAIIAAATTAQQNVPGDLDNSGVIDFDDFDEFVDELLSNDELWEAGDNPELYEKYEKYDVNGDGYVDVADAQALLNLTLGLNIDGTLPSSVRAKHAVVNTLSAAGFNLGNGVTRYVISLDDSREFAAFQMQIAGEVLAVNSDDAKLMTKQTAKGMRVLGFANNEVLAKSQVLTVDVKGSAQFKHITFATLGATSVAFEINVATGINVMADQNNGAARYDLSGRKLQSAQKGVNVVRNADGQVRKVLVK